MIGKVSLNKYILIICFIGDFESTNDSNNILFLQYLNSNINLYTIDMCPFKYYTDKIWGKKKVRESVYDS